VNRLSITSVFTIGGRRDDPPSVLIRIGGFDRNAMTITRRIANTPINIIMNSLEKQNVLGGQVRGIPLLNAIYIAFNKDFFMLSCQFPFHLSATQTAKPSKDTAKGIQELPSILEHRLHRL